MKKAIALIILSVLLTTGGRLSADFNDIGAGARQLGMGSAFIGLADDAAAVYYNPSGIGSIGRAALTTGLRKLYWGLRDGSAISSGFTGFVYPVDELSGIGAGMLSCRLGGLYRESSIYVSYGRSIREKMPEMLAIDELSDLYVGFSLKLLSKSYDEGYLADALEGGYFDADDPVFPGNYSKSGVAVDIGALYRYNYNLSAGIVINNLLTPNLGFETAGFVGRSLKIGGAYRVPSMNVLFDACLSGGALKLKLGAEKWILNGKLALRVGLGNSLYFGAGYRFRENLCVDYCYNSPMAGIKTPLGTHMVSFNINFGGISEKMEKLQKAEEEQRKAAQQLRNTMVKEEQSRLETSMQYYGEALDYAENGDFMNAQQKINSALTLNTENMDVQNLFKKLNVVSTILPAAKENDAKSVLMRKGVENYIKDDAKNIINVFQYLSEKYPDDNKIRDFMRVMKKEYPNIVRQEKVSAGMNMVDQKLFRALNYMYDGKYDLAINECQSVLYVEPDNVVALTRMGSASYVLGQQDRAIKLWLKAMAINPDNEELKTFLDEKGINSGELARISSEAKEQEAAYLKSMKYYSDRKGTMTGEARVSTLKRIIEKYRDKKVDISEAENELAKIAGESQKKTVEKTAPGKTAPAKEEPGTEKKKLTGEEKIKLKKQYYARGLDCYNRGEFRKAISEFEKLLEIEPGHPQSLRLISQCKEKIK